VVCREEAGVMEMMLKKDTRWVRNAALVMLEC
jgi:hypothetical protein